MAALFLFLYNYRSLFSFCKCLLGGNNVHKLNYKSVHLGRPKRWNNARRTIDNHPKIHHSTKLGDPKIWCGAKSRGESHSLHIPSGHVQWTIHTRAFFVCEHFFSRALDIIKKGYECCFFCQVFHWRCPFHLQVSLLPLQEAWTAAAGSEKADGAAAVAVTTPPGKTK